MNRIDPGLFSKAFPSWVREAWSDRSDASRSMERLRDGKTWRRRHASAKGQAPLHLVSAFAATRRRVLGQAADEGKTNQRTAIPARRDRWAEKDGLKGAIVAIDAIATHPGIAGAIRAAGAADRRAVKANQPTPALRSRACSRRPIRKVSPSPSVSPRATAPSPSTSGAPPRTNEASNSGENRPDGTPNIAQPCSATSRVNPDSAPGSAPRIKPLL